jgi:hypothetical protein
MAERDIVGGLFGVTPEMYQQQRQQQQLAEAIKMGSLTPEQFIGTQAYRGGQALGNVAGGLLGVEDPELMKIRDVQQMRTQFDVSTPDGLRSFAQALGQKGYTDLAAQAAAEADRRGLVQAQTVRALREPGMQSFEKLISSGKYTPASLAKYQQSGNVGDLVLTKEATGGADGVGAGPGPVGKAGAYRDAFGQIYGGSEMKAVRQEFDTNEKLLTMLNKVTEDDVKKAESIIDWTTKEGVVKGAGAKLASDTVTAQTKIAASQLLKQIESLPPGSASNADMVAAMKDFPGYGSQAALAAWINRAKETIQTNLGRQVEQFGFRQRVQSTPALNMAQKPEKSATKEKAPKVIKLD